ncbi:MAG: PIG-L family deacetylase [Crocinitomicaceae bacterium]|nr:PIG-L family deacetylase [Crocinitomicaceae bacterium]
MKAFRTLYIFPHPDDESFGPAPVIYRQTKRGEEVFLLTLTRGGATKVRFKYNYTIDEMGEVRVKEMEKVKQVLNLTGMDIWDMEDGSLAYMNPVDLENRVAEHIKKINPDIVVTYAVHGISGHHDHLAIHATIKRIFSESDRNIKFPAWKRLALFTFPKPENSEQDGAMAHVRTSPVNMIDCVVELNQEEKLKLREALYCYDTFVEVIESTKVIDHIGDKVYFEFFNEDFKPVLKDIADRL